MEITLGVGVGEGDGVGNGVEVGSGVGAGAGDDVGAGEDVAMAGWVTLLHPSAVASNRISDMAAKNFIGLY